MMRMIAITCFLGILLLTCLGQKQSSQTQEPVPTQTNGVVKQADLTNKKNNTEVADKNLQWFDSEQAIWQVVKLLDNGSEPIYFDPENMDWLLKQKPQNTLDPDQLFQAVSDLHNHRTHR